MTIENYVALSVGVIALLCGPLIVRNRRKIFGVISDTLRALGGTPGRQVVKMSSPFWVGFTGVVLAAIGVIAIIAGVFVREPLP
ncbi:hypothetical protein GCM10010458_05200 [Microbacterium luteolum]